MVEIDLNTVLQLSNKKKCFIVTMGAPASGKSTFINNNFRTYDVIDVDEIVVEISGGLYNRSNVSAAIIEMKNRLFKAFKNNKTFINVSTSKNFKSLVNKLKTGLNHEFTTIMIYFQESNKTCIKRNKDRRISGKGLSDEYEWKIEFINSEIKKHIQNPEIVSMIDYLLIVKNDIHKTL